MTGFGKAQTAIKRGTITIDIRTLNSKQLDVNLRMPALFRELEGEIRNMLSASLERGKIDFQVLLKSNLQKTGVSINTEIVQEYFEKFKPFSEELKVSNDTLFGEIMKLPEVIVETDNKIEDEEWTEIKDVIFSALRQVDEFRVKEGKGLESELLLRIQLIEQHLQELGIFEQERMQNVRAKLKSKIDELLKQDAGSPVRFEEEMIYYLEKLDISEEKQRLKAHCDYFRETISHPASQGRKLAFITQEIGREINTIGSKSNHAEMQKKVVLMKDELEKIKEQLNNIL
jgi:uncharacterized protein (TIGR00255 family)